MTTVHSSILLCFIPQKDHVSITRVPSKVSGLERGAAMSVREKEWHCGTKCDASPAQTNRLETVQHHGCSRRFTYRREQVGGGSRGCPSPFSFWGSFQMLKNEYMRPLVVQWIQISISSDVAWQGHIKINKCAAHVWNNLFWCLYCHYLWPFGPGWRPCLHLKFIR